MQTLPSNSLQTKCNLLALAATGANAKHFAFYEETKSKTLTRRSIHYRCLLFWTCLEQGAAAAALCEGTAYLDFADKYLRDSHLAGSLNPRPDDLVELIELLVALCVMSYKMGHSVILPKSYLLPLFCRYGLCFSPGGPANSWDAYSSSIKCLPVLERQIFSILQGMVQGRIFTAMRLEERLRQASFDDWRDLCVRLSMALIFLTANCKEQAQLRSVWDKLQSLSKLDVDHTVMDSFRFPRTDRESAPEAFLGRSPINLLERVGSWYAKCVDGLMFVVRADFKHTENVGRWKPEDAELVVFAPKADPPVVLVSKEDCWMSKTVRPWIKSGAKEWSSEQDRQVSAEGQYATAAEAQSGQEEQSGVQSLDEDLESKEQVIKQIHAYESMF
jgi:hypothetical protein